MPLKGCFYFLCLDDIWFGIIFLFSYTFFAVFGSIVASCYLKISILNLHSNSISSLHFYLINDDTLPFSGIFT